MDLSPIAEVLGLAKTAASLTGQAADAAEKVKSLFGVNNAPEEAEARELVRDLALKLTSANLMNLQISEELVKLSKAFQLEDEFNKRKAGYRLIKTECGDMVFQSTQAEEPSHYLCPVCLQADRIFSFIQVSGLGGGLCQTNSAHNFRLFRRPTTKTSTSRGMTGR